MMSITKLLDDMARGNNLSCDTEPLHPRLVNQVVRASMYNNSTKAYIDFSVVVHKMGAIVTIHTSDAFIVGYDSLPYVGPTLIEPVVDQWEDFESILKFITGNSQILQAELQRHISGVELELA